VREKSVVKRTKVPRALKIHTPSDSDETPKSKETPVPEKEVLVEKDQDTNANDDVSGPKESPLPQPEPLVEDQNATNEGQQDNVQKDNTTLMQDAPNAEQKKDTHTNPEARDKEVDFTFSNFTFSSNSPLFYLNFLCVCRMDPKKKPPKYKISKSCKRLHFHLP
jgi:type IV secretory pathway VirB10-like protein